MESDEAVAKNIAALKTNTYFCEFVKYLESLLDYRKHQMLYAKEDVMVRIFQGKSQALDELLTVIENAEDTLKKIKENDQ